MRRSPLPALYRALVLPARARGGQPSCVTAAACLRMTPLRAMCSAPVAQWPKAKGGCLSGQLRRCAALPSRDNIRNISVIAHVDHGKTTLVDAMLQSGQGSKPKNVMGSRAMDNLELEAERGITIMAKNTSIRLPNHTINIVDTPGHADFSGEVERALQMVEGFILLVDAAEGPRPGTRFVLRKALELRLRPVVVINKIDRASADEIERTKDLIESLFLELAVEEDQLEYPVVYGSGKNGYMNLDSTKREGVLQPLWDTVLSAIPAPTAKRTDCLQMLITSIDFDEKGKKLAVGRMYSGNLRVKDEVFVTDFHLGEKAVSSFKVSDLMVFDGLDKERVESATHGDIVCLRGEGLDKMPIHTGQTLCQKGHFVPLPYKPVDEPTFAVTMHPNRSPLKGKEGTKFGGPEIRERLAREVTKNLAMNIDIVAADEFKICGRGLMHVGVLFEEMRREGFELELSKPQVATKEVDGKTMEPWETVRIRSPSESSGEVTAVMFSANAEQVSMTDLPDDVLETEWRLPARCLMGVPGQLQQVSSKIDLEQEFYEFKPFDKSISTRRSNGCLLASGDGVVTLEGMKNMSNHGSIGFVAEKDKVYRDMIVGMRDKAGDLELNCCKPANHFAATKVVSGLTSKPPTIEVALAYVQDDELVEVTPASIRMRKKARTDKERKEALRK